MEFRVSASELSPCDANHPIACPHTLPGFDSFAPAGLGSEALWG
jgi:hypothetical protein